RLLHPAPIVGHLEPDSRPPLPPRPGRDRPCLRDARRRDLQIEVAAERALDQRVERRIAELLPPRGLERFGLDLRGRGFAELERRRRGRPVVRARGAGRYEERQSEGGKGYYPVRHAGVRREAVWRRGG